MVGGTLRGCAEQVQYRSRWSHSQPAVEGQEVRGTHAGVRDFCDVSRLWKGAWRGHAGEVVPWDLAGQEAALRGTPGDEGGRVGGEVESSKRKVSTPCHGGLDKLISTLHDPTGTVKAATTRTVLPDVHAQEQELGSYKPRRAKITKNIIDKFGPMARCTKCRVITRGDSGMEAVEHSAA